MANLFQKIFHVGDPVWAKLGKSIGGSQNNPYPDRWVSRDLSNGTKVTTGVGIIIAGTVAGGPIGAGVVTGCVATGIVVGVMNSHFRQRRLDNLQSFAGNINAKARFLSQTHEVDAHGHQNCGHDHSHKHHSHTVNEEQNHRNHNHGHDNCSDKITHGVTHSIQDKKWKFLAIFAARHATNSVTVVRTGLPIVNIAAHASKATLSTVASSSAGIGVANDSAIGLVDGARAGYYAYHIYNEEYKRYTDVVEKRDSKLLHNNPYYSSQQAFSLLKNFIVTKQYDKLSTAIKCDIKESDNIEGFLKKATDRQRKWGKETSPITAIAFVMDNFTLITESKERSIPEDEIKTFLEESYSHFEIKERWGPRQGMLPYRNDVVYHLSDDGKKEEISLRSWQVKQQLSFDQKKIESLSLQQDDDKFTQLRDKIDNIIDSDLKKRKLGRVQYQNIYNILMIESLELGNLDVAINTMDTLSKPLDGKKLSPSVIREKLSKNTYGHPHQELDGYAQKPAKLLGSLDHNITYSELCEALSSTIKDKIPRPPELENLVYLRGGTQKRRGNRKDREIKGEMDLPELHTITNDKSDNIEIPTLDRKKFKEGSLVQKVEDLRDLGRASNESKPASNPTIESAQVIGNSISPRF